MQNNCLWAVFSGIALSVYILLGSRYHLKDAVVVKIDEARECKLS